MDHALTKQWAMAEQDQRISEVVKRERSRLRNFIRRRVADPSDVEDILQDVFYRLVEANRLLMPIEHVTGWLFRVARNRIKIGRASCRERVKSCEGWEARDGRQKRCGRGRLPVNR